MFTFSELQSEVKRGGTRDKSGTAFDTPVKNLINRAIYKIARAGLWRPLRRTDTFDTIIAYTTGSDNVAVTNGSKSVTVTNATFLTDNIAIGRLIELGGSTLLYRIVTITGETTLTVDINYDGTTSTTQTYSILGQEQYNLPVQTNHRMFLWHEVFGYPYVLTYMTDQTFLGLGIPLDTEATPEVYRMWGEDMVIDQLLEGSVISLSSSDSADTSQPITIFGIVSGFPDFEIINTDSSNGTTSVNGSKTFTKVERVVANESTRTGRITVTANSGNVDVAILPVGKTTREILYRKVQLHPLPNVVHPINVFFYKTPYSLVNNGDVHELGEDFDSAIVYLATGLLRFETSQKEAKEWFALYRDEIKDLKKTNLDKIDWLVTLKNPSRANAQKALVRPNLFYGQVGANFGPPSGGF